MRSWTRLLVLPAVLACGPGACSPAAGERPNIILFTVDTLRADRVGAYGNAPPAGSPTPLADRLAAAGVLFERCFVPRGVTHPSLASLLTGKYPATHGLRRNGQPLAAQHVPLPVHLRRAGYRTAGFAANLDVSRWPFWVRGLEIAEDGVEGRLLEEGGAEAYRWQRIWDDRTVTKALHWIESLPEGEPAPVFLWVHLYDVHSPYCPAEEWAERYRVQGYEGPAAYPGGRAGAPPEDLITPLLAGWTLGKASHTPADLEQVKALYDAGARGCDEKLALVHRALDERGLLENALVIYSADHGDELGDHHDYFYHGNSIYDGTLHVPLIVSWPEVTPRGRRIHGLTQNLDLFPTLLEVAGVPVPVDVEGLSLLPVLRGMTEQTGRTHVLAEWEDLIFSVADGDWKYIHNPRGANPRRPPYAYEPQAAFPYECHELYHVAVDPREQQDLFDRNHPQASTLLAVIERFLARPEHRSPVATAGVDLDGLAALGYVGGDRDSGSVRFIDCGDRK